jgi:hypothetical protein
MFSPGGRLDHRAYRGIEKTGCPVLKNLNYSVSGDSVAVGGLLFEKPEFARLSRFLRWKFS